MKPQVLFVTLVVVAVLAALPFAESQDGGSVNPLAGATPWPCCDNCGSCTRSIPPQCKCSDASPRGCHPSCKSCISSGGKDSSGAPLFVCNDRIKNYCSSRCTPKA